MLWPLPRSISTIRRETVSAAAQACADGTKVVEDCHATKGLPGREAALSRQSLRFDFVEEGTGRLGILVESGLAALPPRSHLWSLLAGPEQVRDVQKPHTVPSLQSGPLDPSGAVFLVTSCLWLPLQPPDHELP